MWNSLDIYIGLIIACLPSLRPYLRSDFGASDYSHPKPDQQTGSTPCDGQTQGGFKELNEVSSYKNTQNMHVRSRPFPSQDISRVTDADEWDHDDGYSRSEIELISIDTKASINV